MQVDGMAPYEEPDQFAYETSADDVMNYVTPAMYDGGDVVRFEWTDDVYQEPYEYFTHDVTQDGAFTQGVSDSHDTHTDTPVSNAITSDYEDGNRTMQDIDDVEMTQSRRHESWSDESSFYDDVEAETPLTRDSTHDSCFYESRVRADTANLKHVFVDVHRSMTCSCDDVRNSQIVLNSKSDKLFRHNDVTKHISFRVFRNKFARPQNLSKMHPNSFLFSLALSSDRTNRRYSV